MSNGIFNVPLGTSTALTLPSDAQYDPGVIPGADPEMSPRQPPAASPYAIRAATSASADRLATGGSLGQVLAGTGSAPAWTASPTLTGNLTGTASTFNVAAPQPNTLTTVDAVGDVGQFTSVTVAPDGLPVISYFDASNGRLKVAGTPHSPSARMVCRSFRT